MHGALVGAASLLPLTHIQAIQIVLNLTFVSWEMKWFLQVLLQQIQANHSWNFWANTSEPAKVFEGFRMMR